MKHIGLIFPENDNWTGGSNYVLNLLEALIALPKNDRPRITVFYAVEKDKNAVLALVSEGIECVPFTSTYSGFEIFMNKVSRLFFYRNLFHRKFVSSTIDALFPVLNHNYFPPSNKNIYWIPDFQEHYLPHFFTSRQLKSRRSYQQSIANGNHKIVFSSKDALKDFRQIFPKSNATCFVVNFAIASNNIRLPDKESLLKKYNLPEQFFFTPNQFWAHKNHSIVLLTASRLKKMNNKTVFVFSGKETDHRNPQYFQNLKRTIQQENIVDSVRFLGFIPREDLLGLMKHSIAVIQPSLFEGWSTVVEDAKLLESFVLASDISVHHEQLKENVLFFDPHSEESLTDCILKVLKQRPVIASTHYEEKVETFRRDFIAVLK